MLKSMAFAGYPFFLNRQYWLHGHNHSLEMSEAQKIFP